MEDPRRRLLWHGIFLFMLGLLAGFVEQQFINPRMGLSAHLGGVMNGIFLLALGAVWAAVRNAVIIGQLICPLDHKQAHDGS